MWRESLKELGETIRTHPRFDAAAQRMVADLLAWRGRLGVLNKIVMNVGRERIIEHLLYLHYGRGQSEPRHGATFERLAHLSEARDGFGARAVRTALRLAQIGGMVTLTRSQEDGRLRIFEPTPLLLATASEYYAYLAGAFDTLLPEETLARRFVEDTSFLPQMLVRSAEAYFGQEPRNAIPDAADYLALLKLEGGRVVLNVAADCHWRQQDLPPMSELSRRYYVSPSQARVILKTANAAGLVKLGPRGKLLDATPLIDIYGRVQSRYLAFLARYGLGLEDRLRQSARAP